ncbi:hypothetical protein M2105_005137, partial [Paenibacillus sp. PastF-1]|nr:hypothetical protein [Paenibacillus sp. PastF-1]
MKTEQRVSIGIHFGDSKLENVNSRQMFQNERIALTIVFGWLFPWSDSGEVTARKNLIGEFDPGSGRTLAACLIHA